MILEFLKIINILDETTYQPSKFRTRNWVKTNDESRGIHDGNSDIKYELQR